jgi:hypothetical protein
MTKIITLTTKIGSATQRGAHTVTIEIPEPITNTAGAVTIGEFHDGAHYVMLSIVIDERMRKAKIKKLDAGQIEHGEQGAYLACTAQGGRLAGILLANRPELRELAENRDAIKTALYAAREAIWSQERAEERRSDDALISAMHVRAGELREQLPDGALLVELTQVGDADGDPIYEYTSGGVKLSWQDCTIIGSASAVRPGAQGAFAHVVVACTTQEMIDAARARAHAKAEREHRARESHTADITRTVPPAAISAYTNCQGDPERFGEGIDDPRYWLVREWADAIEHQGLARIDPSRYARQYASQAEADAND